MSTTDILEESIVAAVMDDVNKFCAVTLDTVKSETKLDTTLTMLMSQLRSGFPKSQKDMPPEIRYTGHFKKICH